jgi:hypothetical protein
MSTIELKQELFTMIDSVDAVSVKSIYKIVKEYLSKSEETKMILESEKDIKLGNIHTQYEVKKMIENWKE